MVPQAILDRLPAPLLRLAIVGETAIDRYVRDRSTMFAGAIAYNVLFSIFPLALALVGLSGYLLRDASRRDRLIASIQDALPVTEHGGDIVATAVNATSSGAGAATVVALVGLIWSSTAMMGAMRIAVDTALGRGIRRRPYVISKLIDLAFVGGVGLLALSSVLLTVVSRVASRFSDVAADWPDPLPQIVDRLASSAVPFAVMVISALIFATIYRVLPARPPHGIALLLAVAIATISFEVLKRGYAFYVTQFADYTSVYGSLGAVIASLFFVYLAASILIAGAQAGAAWRDTSGGRHRVGEEPPAAGAGDVDTASPRPPERLAAAGLILLVLALVRRVLRRR